MFKLLKSLPALKHPMAPTSRCHEFFPILPRAYATVPRRWRPPRKVPKCLIKLGAIPVQDAIDVFRALSIGEEDTYFEIQVLYSKKYTRPIQGSVFLPTPMPQKTKVLVFAEGKEAELATSLGADYVGGQELIAKVQASEIKFDQVLCTPGMYPHVVKIARTLGPLGLMPTPKKGTVTSDIAAGIDKLRGLHKFRSDIHGCIHTQNIVALLYAIFEIGAPTVKKGFLEKIVLKTQLGPPIVLEDAFGLVLDQWNLSKLSGPQTA